MELHQKEPGSAARATREQEVSPQAGVHFAHEVVSSALLDGRHLAVLFLEHKPEEPFALATALEGIEYSPTDLGLSTLHYSYFNEGGLLGERQLNLALENELPAKISALSAADQAQALIALRFGRDFLLEPNASAFSQCFSHIVPEEGSTLSADRRATGFSLMLHDLGEFLQRPSVLQESAAFAKRQAEQFIDQCRGNGVLVEFRAGRLLAFYTLADDLRFERRQLSPV